jgi:hypothetical protein
MTPERPGKQLGDAAHGSTDGSIGYRKLRAPSEEGGVLIEPPLAEAANVVQGNLAIEADRKFEMLGKPYGELASQARASLLDVAFRYMRGYRNVEADNRRGSVVVSGHQPQLFHPGVWFKNFLLVEIGKRSKAQPVNLIIDNDTVRETSIRTPSRSSGDALLESVPYDSHGQEIPFEERVVLDEAIFRTFAERVRATLPDYVGKARSEPPLAESLWRTAREVSMDEMNLGRRLAKLRNLLEAEWGAAQWEAPLSEVCNEPPFLWFASDILANLPRFAKIYNAALVEYRRVHRIRNARHPMPPLETSRRPDEWSETPFWIWTSADPLRKRLFARVVGRSMEISDRANVTKSLRLSPDGRAEGAVEALVEAAREGIRLRPRALVTTLYARLFLSDLFIHGIGGAKYDQVTDAVIERYYGERPPAFVTATATFRLPIERPIVAGDELRRLQCEVREMQFHPERFLAEDRETTPVRQWVDDKLRWTESPLARENLTIAQRRERHADMSRANAALSPLVAGRIEAKQVELESLTERFRSARILGSREFSFCLFPEQSLVEQMNRALG